MKKLLLISILFIACKKNGSDKENPQPYYMRANINGKPWDVRSANNRFSNATFQSDYDFNEDTWNIRISGDNQRQDTLCYAISISFYFLPKKGRYYFNNTLSQNALKGISAFYIYYNKISNQFETRYSIDGYVDIDEFTKEEMKGSFNFKARGDAQDSTVKSLTQGSFYVYYGGGGGKPWTGP